MACPVGGINIDPVTDTAFKCDLCNGDPECVKVCDPGAIKYVSKDLLDLTLKRAKSEKITELFALMQSLR
jgi:Fe-S-cluster-containing hydrogenase component 2